MYLYFGEREGQPLGLRLVIGYVAEDWLFVEKYYVKADNQTFTIDPGGDFEVKRDNSGGEIWEWFDTEVTPEEYVILKALVSAKSATLRYEGQKHYRDRNVGPAERQRIADVLVTLEALDRTV
jgi:hypothetical protein